ncbi:MAG: DNA ligase-associated DEXH box helicase, partial [Erythrobacter cryptus]
RKYEPDHLLIEAAWADARARMTDVARLADLLERSRRALVHVALDRVSPLAVPVMTMIGREAVPQGAVDEALLLEADGWSAAARRPVGGAVAD